MCLDIFRWARDVCLDPQKNTKKRFTFMEFTKMNLTVAILPIAVYSIAALLGIGDMGQAFGSFAIFGLPVFIGLAFAMVAIIPFVLAGLVHLFSKRVFNLMKGDYHATYSAASYAILPCLLFGWVPFFGSVLSAGWGFVTGIYALANQQKIDNKRAFWSIVIPMLITMVIVILVSVAAMSYLYNAIGLGGMMGDYGQGMMIDDSSVIVDEAAATADETAAQ